MTSTAEVRAEAAGQEDFLSRIRSFVGLEATPIRHAQEPVNRPMVRHFVEAMGDENPIYLDEEAARAAGRDSIVAPPPMLSSWLMVGYKAHTAAPEQGGTDSPMARLLGLLAEAGFTGVVATNDEHEYLRELHPGDQLAMSTVIEDVSARKQTGLGSGHFVTTLRTYTDQQGEVVARQRFRILRFAPGSEKPQSVGDGPDPAQRPQPFLTRDNEFWFDAAREHRLVIQCCSDCGALRHPPAPACPQCRSFAWHEAPASGRGTVHSFVVNHHPQAPGFTYPLAVLLVDLEEGTRLVADFVGDPGSVEIGMPVEIEWLAYTPEVTLPRFRVVEEAP